MSDDGSPDGVRQRDVVLSILGLAAVAVAQPLLDLVGRNPPFFAAHDMVARDVVVVALGLAVLAPLAVAVVVLLVLRVHRGTGVVIGAAVVASLVAALALVTARLSGIAADLPAAATLAGAALVGAGVGGLWAWRRAVRRVVDLLAFAVPAVLVLFLALSPARAVLRPPDRVPAGDVLHRDAAPIVMVVFDELPVVSLLGADRRIDAETFPAFGRLAQDATWYRNATTVHGFTPNAVPAILTGRYTPDEALPVAADHPPTLFSRVADSAAINALEPVTKLCATCATTGRADYGQILRDLAVLQGHLLAPPALAARLPSLDQGFADFRAEVARRGKHDAFIGLLLGELDDDLPAEFAGFVADLRTVRGSLNFAHVLLPHRPWRYLPDGRVYAGTEDITGTRGRSWRRGEWPAAHGYQRHLLQLQFTDRLLGDLLDELEAAGAYDDALIVVTADHGISFTPGAPLRGPSEHALAEVVAVPLLIKAPGQSRGSVTDAPVETVDILPTVLDLLGAPVPAGLDGQSAADPDAVQREVKQLHTLSGTIVFPAHGQHKWSKLDHKLALFGAGDPPLDPYRLAPRGAGRWLGQPVPDTVEAPALSVTLDAPQLYDDVDLTAPALPVLLSGVVSGAARPPTLVIGVNGRIVAATRADAGDAPHAFRAMLPPPALREGRNEVAVFAIGPSGRLQRLARD